ncbi:MAG: hypothetical protein V3V29_08975 [Acidimicrobiia bacterium]
MERLSTGVSPGVDFSRLIGAEHRSALGNAILNGILLELAAI